MAKDAKGHGSNGRAGRSGAIGVAAQHGIPTGHLVKVIPMRPAGDTNPFPTRTTAAPFGRRK